MGSFGKGVVTVFDIEVVGDFATVVVAFATVVVGGVAPPIAGIGVVTVLASVVAGNVVNDNAVNAWCMPGGMVVVYTGILPVAQDETGLAVVMGHEIAHAFRTLADSYGERLLVGEICLPVDQLMTYFSKQSELHSRIDLIQRHRELDSKTPAVT